MILSISIKNIDPLTSSQVVEKIIPLLNNSEKLSFDYKKEGEENEESYKELLGVLLATLCRHNPISYTGLNMNQIEPCCLERTDTYGRTCSTGA